MAHSLYLTQSLFISTVFQSLYTYGKFWRQPDPSRDSVERGTDKHQKRQTKNHNTVVQGRHKNGQTTPLIKVGACLKEKKDEIHCELLALLLPYLPVTV